MNKICILLERFTLAFVDYEQHWTEWIRLKCNKFWIKADILNICYKQHKTLAKYNIMQ
jgi:hypothetical protein